MEDQKTDQINTGEEIEVKDNIKTSKPWPGGIKIFPTVKVNPPQPASLGIRVGDGIKINEHLG